MTRIIVEGGNEQLVELLKVATQQAARPAEPEPDGSLDSAALTSWLTEQFEDPALEATMLRGSLDSSPYVALTTELIRRAGG